MYLKSLKLVGFKSFADRTRLELRPGVTVVVGPNGSGKSNLVDAVSWVMGTQSAKSLRTPRMEDVIFAGTTTRPALNRCEVTLVFDNESRTLPLDLDEVAITRRLYRDGSSDYELNGVGCRLVDISDLLADSGVGRSQHVIVGQGQIDTVLNSGPDDHRAVIEEAAGILKHRRRKERAIRRLERTDGDLVRLSDIVGELARQMRPLKRQANAATQHSDLTEAVRGMRLYLGGERLRSLDDRAETLSQERESLTRGLHDLDAETEELATALHILMVEASGLGATLDRYTGAAARLETILERIRRSVSIAQERRRAGVARRHGAAERRRDMTNELTSLIVELDNLVPEVQQRELAATRHERRFRALEDEARSLADQGNLTPEGALVVVRGEVRALENAQVRDEREMTQVDHRRSVIEAQLTEDAEELTAVNDDIRRLDGEAVALQTAYEKTQRVREQLQSHWEDTETKLTTARLAEAAAAARLDAIRASVEGAADPLARRTMEQSDGHRGSVVALLDVPDHLSAAVDAALGAWGDAGVFTTRERLDGAVARLKSSGRGGVPMVSAETVAPCPAREVAARAGAVALVDVLGDGVDQTLAVALIGDVVLVEGWQSAVALVSRHPGLRVVTTDGDLVTSLGFLVAHPDGATPVMLEAAEVSLERETTELGRIESLHGLARRDFERSRQAEREALERLEAVEARLSGATDGLGRITRSRTNLEEEMARLMDRRRSLTEAAEERTADIDRLHARLRALEGEEAERQEAWEEMERRRGALEADRETARAAWQEATAELGAARERLELLEGRRAAVESGLAVEVTTPAGDDELERLALVEEVARHAMELISDRLGVLRGWQTDLRARSNATGAQREAVNGRHEASRRHLETARTRLGEVDLEATEVRVRREGVAEGLRRDADTDEATALAAPRPAIAGDLDHRGLEARLAEAEARLRRMGPVNPLAAQEYSDLEQRHRFLSDQVADLASSRDDLRRVIGALDNEIAGRFLAAYAEVAEAFKKHFSVLFPGGRGMLSLAEPDDPLATGVEIEAQPLGKKVSQLSLLSGGERSLAALAFLFAVFEARPSPFYLLDEVEAALDDANLRRFVLLVETFRSQAQLVIVTHQQQTMEGADVLYGVTMEPGGSSTVVRKEMVVDSGATDRERDLAAPHG